MTTHISILDKRFKNLRFQLQSCHLQLQYKFLENVLLKRLDKIIKGSCVIFEVIGSIK